MNTLRLRRKPGLRLSLVTCAAVLAVFLSFAPAHAQVPSPSSVLGFTPGDDKKVADWEHIVDYFDKLDKASKKVAVQRIGTTTNGKPMIVAFISSADNIKKLDKYRQISAKLADPRTISSEAELADLVKNGKTIVSISCSIHSTELVAAQMSMSLAYELASSSDAATKEILDNTILLLIPSSNPDGVDIVADWYRKTLGTKSEGTSPPELYHHYAGHDDNRDWFMLNLKETQAITNLFWKQWFPQIVYDVHQQGNNASRFILPPFFDPVNPRISPSILRDVGTLGYKMASDLEARGIAGVATNSTYDTWWNGGFRTAPYFHNSIGILSEAASTSLMTPVTIKEADLGRNRTTRGLANLLEPATNYPDPWRGGLWRPSDIANIEMIASRSLLQMAAKFREHYLRDFYANGKANLADDVSAPRAFIVTAGQPNAETVSRMLEILIAQGIEVHQMTTELNVKTSSAATDWTEVPNRSFVIFTDQPQRDNVLSLFEKQVYPDRRLPNGDAEAPYDVAGWTLPLQMGVDVAPAWSIKDLDRARGGLRPVTNINDARSVLNLPPATEAFQKIADPLRTNPRIGVYKGNIGSMDEGWTRWVLDTFQIPYHSITDAEVRTGDLPFDAIVLPSDSENQLVNGLNAQRYPAAISGGMSEAGVENLKKYVDGGGKLICFDASCEMVIKRFGLPIKNALAGIRRNEFYDPGSIVALDVNTSDPLARGLGATTPAYFINSSAYDISDGKKVRTVARYAAKDALLSGWMLGEKYMNGKTALADASYGKGNIVLFAFRPQHRGQSWATFPFIFNALEK